MTEVDQLRERARTALAEGRIEDALAALAAAAGAARGLAAADPVRIALAGEHGDAWFTHRGDPGRALEIATPAYDEAVDAIDVTDPAQDHRAAVRELAALRDRMTFWAFRLPG